MESSIFSKFTRNTIVFEITEKKEEAMMACRNFVTEIENRGFLIALDNIGEGDSTMKYVLELEPHLIKLDQYFTKDLASSPKNN